MISEKIATKRGIQKMSAQAVAGVVGSNPICIIIPCHRQLVKMENYQVMVEK